MSTTKSDIDIEVGLQRRYSVSRSARLRPEGFGGLAYTFQDQKLYFVAAALMPFLTATKGETVGEIAARLEAEHGKKLSQKSLAAIITKLEDLKQKGVLDEQL